MRPKSVYLDKNSQAFRRQATNLSFDRQGSGQHLQSAQVDSAQRADGYGRGSPSHSAKVSGDKWEGGSGASVNTSPGFNSAWPGCTWLMPVSDAIISLICNSVCIVMEPSEFNFEALYNFLRKSPPLNSLGHEVAIASAY